MIKKSFCEQFIKKYSTSVRMAIALKLINKHGLSQFQAAKTVGVSQPLLNYFINGRRRYTELEKILKDRKIVEIIDEVANEIINGSELDMCKICIRIREALDIKH